ncbi:DUF5694 domain-containing protein [Pedobacter metabolipauper]|uniref:Uncharacterized protein n=1 Tax=Pedobacter metabolipauper TaxID=425513 RepID=A0A4R6SYA3_9SPHI|nr:DUF5694 domain-containing protein [Pedobacter metabolipauper]TDQ09475.1 hypothetical protein ATK78_1630 [Pedobacter metabolipauper]
MRKFIYLLLLLPFSVCGQDPIKKITKIFKDDQVKPTVLLLGVFHFAGEQVDVNTTPADLRINMLSPERQQQLKHLVDDLAGFAPTKIVFEAQPKYQAKYDSLYQAYVNGKLVASPAFIASETVQIGFRLAKQLGLKTLYPVDAQAFRFQLSPADSVLTFEKYKAQTDTSFAYWEKRYDEETAYDDTLAYRSTTRQYLRFLNAPEVQARTNGRWLITTKRGSNTEPIGSDGFITRYFNRNVRIYSNIQRVVNRKDERILVIYGATHMYFLKTLFAASPEFKLEDVMKYLEP